MKIGVRLVERGKRNINRGEKEGCPILPLGKMGNYKYVREWINHIDNNEEPLNLIFFF